MFLLSSIVQLTTLQILSELINSLKYVPNSKLALFINIKRLWIRPYWKKKGSLRAHCAFAIRYTIGLL